MNYRQKVYDSYDKSNFNLKIINSYYHFKNIQKILFRKPEYKTIKRINDPPKLKINTEPYRNYFVRRENELFRKAIKDIQSTKVRPKINDFYRMKEEKLKEYKRHNKTLENRQLSRLNLKYVKRLKSQKSSLRIREMDKEYKNNHLKMVEKARKLRETKAMILPPIQTIVNRLNSPKRYKYSGYGGYLNSNRSSSLRDGESLY